MFETLDISFIKLVILFLPGIIGMTIFLLLFVPKIKLDFKEKLLYSIILSIFSYLSNFEFIKDRLSNWATQEAINNDWLEQIKLIIPNDEFLKNYHEKTYWIYKKIYLNQIENQKLVELRDWLLPMLMNWQVRVK